MSSKPEYVTERLFDTPHRPLDCGGGFGSVKVCEGEDEFDMSQAIDDAMEECGYDSDYLDDQDYVGEYMSVHIFSDRGTSLYGHFKDWERAQEIIRAKMEEYDMQIQCKLKNLKAYDALPEEDFEYTGTLMVRKIVTTTNTSTTDNQVPSAEQNTL